MSLSDVCKTHLYSELRGTYRDIALDYFTDKIAHPDIGSEFDKKLGLSKYFFRIPLINTVISGKMIDMLHGKGYDALLLEYIGKSPPKIISHTAFQIHKDNTLHVFSVMVDKDYQGEGLAQYMGERIIDIAHKKHIDRVRLGAGGHKSMEKIIDNIVKKSAFNIEKQNNNWIKLLY